MAEWTSVAEQTVNPGESIVFTENPVPCTRGFVRHRQGDGNFLLSGWLPNRGCPCRCNRNRSATYFVDFGANIAIPEDGTVGEISVAFSLDGSTMPSTIMSVTPAALEEYFNVSRATNVEIWNGCCQSLAIRNVSDQPILVRNANIDFSRPDLDVSY
jgi:hypothetical protein